jgi:opacity protein-like surface antigen
MVLLALGAFAAPGAAQDRPMSIALTGSYTTSSKIFFHPNEPDVFLAGQYSPIDHVAGLGIDVRRAFAPGTIALGLSAEYIDRKASSSVPVNGVEVPVEDGFRAFPVELTGYCILPVGTAWLQVYMGGGGGLYFGERRYVYAGVPSRVDERSATAGIHVLGGLDWKLTELLSLRTEVRFRDVQLSTVNRFAAASATVPGGTVPLPQDPLVSRVNIDGMSLSAGLAYHW